jgi:outer membrane immunogenic protein
MIKRLVGGIALATLALAGSSNAADLPRVAYKAPPPVALFSWTGFYIGVHAGAGWGLKEATFTSAQGRSENQYSISGFLGGAQVGVNYQLGSWVMGAEAQFSWSDLDGKDGCAPSIPAVLLNCHTKADWLGTAAARLAFAFDRTMVFVKAGGAWVHDKHDVSYFAPPFNNFHVEETRWGWMFGTGVEHAFSGNWSAKVEYDYLDFGTRDVNFAGLGNLAVFNPPIPDVTTAIRQRIHLVKFGLNYRFGAGPVVANY